MKFCLEKLKEKSDAYILEIILNAAFTGEDIQCVWFTMRMYSFSALGLFHKNVSVPKVIFLQAAEFSG